MPEEKSAVLAISSLFSDAVIYSKSMMVPISVIFLINTVPLIYAGLYWSEADSAVFAVLLGLLNLFFQILIVQKILRLANRSIGSTRNFVPRLFGLQIIYYLAVTVGFVCFVFPGIYIALRWSLAVPAMISRDLTIGESFEESWNLTKGKLVDLLIAFLPIMMLYVVNMVFLFIVFEDIDLVISFTAIESLTSLSIIASWIIFAVIYVNLVKPEREKT